MARHRLLPLLAIALSLAANSRKMSVTLKISKMGGKVTCYRAKSE
jgi:hypothetical protein